MKPYVTFSTAFVYVDDGIVLAGVMDDDEPFAAFTRVFQYSHKGSGCWWTTDMEVHTTSIAYFGPSDEDIDDFVVLSEEGFLRYFIKDAPTTEKIQGAGVWSDDAEGWGYLSDVQQIGNTLYCAGYSGQVYRRLGPDRWVHADEGILQQVGMQGGQYSIQVINGPHESAIYVAGCLNEPYFPVRASFWNGTVWSDLKLPSVADRITNMFVESEDRIWMCGANGTLLVGNAMAGFQSVSTPDDNQLFLSVCKFNGLLYMGSNLGLFFYDPDNHPNGIRKVATGLAPELQDANIAESYDSILWSIGPKDIARFDGERWERIHHPDNAPI